MGTLALLAALLLSQDANETFTLDLDDTREVYVSVSTAQLKTLQLSLSVIESRCQSALAAQKDFDVGSLTFNDPPLALREFARVVVRPQQPLSDGEVKLIVAKLTGDSRDESVLQQVRRLKARGKPLVPFLAEHVRNAPDYDHCRLALGALRSLGPHAAAAVPPLIARINLLGVVETLETIGAAAIPALTEAIQSDNAELRLTAAYTLSRCGKEGVLALCELTKSPTLEVRRSASGGLRGAHPEAVPYQLELLKDADQQVRCNAALGLVDQAPAPVAVPSLLKLLQEPETKAKRCAAAALGAIHAEADVVVPALIAQLETEAQDVLLRALASYGPAATPAVPALTPILKSRGSDAALQLVKAIGRPAAPCLPALQDLLGRTPNTPLYDALGALGPDAAPAVDAILARGKLGREALATLILIGPAAKKGLPQFLPHLYSYGSVGFAPTNLISGMAAIDLDEALRVLADDLKSTPEKTQFKVYDHRNAAVAQLKGIRADAANLRAAVARPRVSNTAYFLDTFRIERTQALRTGDPVERVIALLDLPKSIDADGTLRYEFKASETVVEKFAVGVKDGKLTQIVRSAP